MKTFYSFACYVWSKKSSVSILVFSTFCIHVFLLTTLSAQVSPYSVSTDWYFGQGGRLTFTGDFPSSAAPAAGYKPTNTSTSVENSTSICFSNRNVALYTNTMQAYNNNPANAAWTDFIRNFSTDGKCAGSSTGGAVAFPDPASPTNAFYVIIANDLTSGGCAGQGVTQYRFTGTGTTVAYNAGPTTIAPTTFASEALTVGTDGTGGYWVIIHDKSTTHTFRVWHYTSGGITGPTDYTFASAVSDVSGAQSYLKISPCQDKIAYHSGGILTVHSFNRTSGVIGAELRRITPGTHGVGLEFSPDGNIVYHSGQATTVGWVNISSGATGTVAGSASWSMQLGNDGNIYASPGGTSIGVITSANTASPSYGTLGLTSPGSTFRGLINLAWLTPNTPAINTSINQCGVDFSHLFKNYFTSNVTTNNTTFSWNFGDGNTSTSVAPSHTYASSGTYNVTLSFKDQVCDQTWSANTSVIVSCTTPVTWLDFDVSLKKQQAVLSWSTASEENNDYFEIQRSDDGIHFYTIGKVSGNGNANHISSYEFIDDQPQEAAYYRIVQVDFDGQKSATDAILLSTNDNLIVIAPVPSRDQFTLSLGDQEAAEVCVFDALGKLVIKENTNGTPVSFGENLPSGTYTAVIKTQHEVVAKKIIKQ